MSGLEAGLKRAPSPSLERPGKRAHVDKPGTSDLHSDRLHSGLDLARPSTKPQAAPESEKAQEEHMSDDEMPRRRLDKGKGKAKAPLELPETVWHKIFEFYYDAVCESWNESNRLPHALTPLLLNREITAYALPILYCHPHIDHHRITPFIRCIAISEPNNITPRKKLMRHLTVRPSPPVKHKDMRSESAMRELNSVHTALPTLLQHFPALFSFTLRDTLITTPWSANILFDAFRRITPKKVRLEIRMWDLHDSRIGQDLISHSYPSIYAPFTGIAAVPSAPGSFDNLTQPVGGSAAFRNGSRGDSAAELMQECWRSALLNGGEVQFPSWWLDPRASQQVGEQQQQQVQPQGSINSVPLSRGGDPTSASFGGSGDGSAQPGAASASRPMTLRAFSDFMQSDSHGPLAPHPSLSTIGPSQPQSTIGNSSHRLLNRWDVQNGRRHNPTDSAQDMSYDAALAARLQAQFVSENDGGFSGLSTSDVLPTTGRATIDADVASASEFEIIDHPTAVDEGSAMASSQATFSRDHQVGTSYDGPVLYCPTVLSNHRTANLHASLPADDTPATIEGHRSAASAPSHTYVERSEARSPLQSTDTQMGSEKSPNSPTCSNIDSGSAIIHQSRAYDRVKSLSRTDLFTASTPTNESPTHADGYSSGFTGQAPDCAATRIGDAMSSSSLLYAIAGSTPAGESSGSAPIPSILSRDTPNAEGLTEFAGMALNGGAKALLRALMNRLPSEERQRHIRDYLALVRAGGVRGVPPQRSLSGPPPPDAHALYKVSGGRMIVALGRADHEPTRKNERELARISRWASSQAAVPLQMPAAPQMPPGDTSTTDEDDLMIVDAEWLAAADNMDDDALQEHMRQRYNRLEGGSGGGPAILTPFSLGFDGSTLATVPMPRPAGSYPRFTAPGVIHRHSTTSPSSPGLSAALHPFIDPTPQAGNINAIAQSPQINEHRASAMSSHLLASELRIMLRALIRDRWSPTLQALSFVGLDPLSSIIVRAPELDLWTQVAVPHIRIHLPRGCNSLFVFKGNEELLRDGRRRLIAEGHLPANDPADGDLSRIVGGDGSGNDLVHPVNRLFEIEVNTLAELRDDDMWFSCGMQLPPQVCRIVAGEQDWREVRIGPSTFGGQSDYSDSIDDPSPATSQFNSPTFSFLSMGTDEDVLIMSGDEGESYDAEAARAQRERFAARAAESAKSKLNQA